MILQLCPDVFGGQRLLRLCSEAGQTISMQPVDYHHYNYNHNGFVMFVCLSN